MLLIFFFPLALAGVKKSENQYNANVINIIINSTSIQILVGIKFCFFLTLSAGASHTQLIRGDNAG